MMLLLDTHALVWLDTGSPRLGPVALAAINNALASGQLGVATISFWEIAMLIEKKRLTMKMKLEEWRLDLLRTGLQEIPLRGSTAVLAGQLISFHGDPADRLIMATAIENETMLMTADEKILTWDQYPNKIDARR